MIRRAMSKKKQSEIIRERQAFIFGDEERGIPGALRKGIPEQVASDIYDEILDFANYAFNKAHAIGYAVISYQTAYLKCYYPREYMAALLSSVLDNTTKISEYINECREIGIKLLPPDINESDDGFVVSGETIRYGLAAVKNIGRGFLRSMVAERERSGPFTSFEDFCSRMYGHDLNKRAVESLIKAGAFDSLGVKRRQLLLVFPKVMDSVANEAKQPDGQLDMFGGHFRSSRMWGVPTRELMTGKEVTGLYLSATPWMNTPEPPQGGRSLHRRIKTS